MPSPPMSPDTVALLHEARAAEKAQALYYRALAAEAERRGDAALSERYNELHADEQHHLSRITARLIELGEALDDLAGVGAGTATGMDGWESAARIREEAEVGRYRALLSRDMDDETAALLRGILATEEAHARELGGKWTPA